ncbi:MAG: transthyretin-like family protein [Proteobacteria bacterium]|nr:transthyretin-like family protein [Pseudomonadota bacterium]
MKFLFFFLFLFLSQKVYSVEITVKTSFNSQNVEGVDVLVYKAEEHIYRDKYLFSSQTDKEGNARFRLSEGKYFLAAEKKLKDGILFGFYGLNPIYIREPQTINLILVKYEKDFIRELREKRIEGFVFYEGNPVENAGIYIYLDLSTELKGPPYLFAVTDERGFFSLDIPEGSYYIIFRKRQNSGFGPPSSGDLIGFFPQFPLVINKKGVKISTNLFKIPEKRDLSKNKNLFLIKGKLVLKDGNPAEKYYVGLYDNRELLGKPVYVSTQTDSNGNFSVYVKEKGKYYVGIRNNLGDTPSEDEEVFYFNEIDITDANKEMYFEIIID